MSKNTKERQRLVAIAKAVAREKRDFLKQLKGKAGKKIDRGDFVWHSLLESYASMGNIRGVDGLIENHENYDKVTFDALSSISDSQRLSHIERTFRDAKVRMPGKKARWLARNFNAIKGKKMGGLASEKARLLCAQGRQGKMEFLKSFVGIGDKYARNIMMDLYDKDFRESIAIDARIIFISNALGLSFRNYEDHEHFYLDVAHDAGLNGWELDRLMWKFKDEFIGRLSAGGKHNSSKDK